MKRLVIVSLLTVLLLAEGSLAMQPAIIGGIRDGLAIGFMGEQAVGRNFGMRVGLEANTGGQPIIFFFGGKFYLANIGRRMPMSLGVGLVSYFGHHDPDYGLSISLVFNNFFDVKPLFFEVGVDAVGRGRLQAQLGYKLY